MSAPPLLVVDGLTRHFGGLAALEDVSFDAPAMSGQELVVDAEYVNSHLADVVKDEDLSRYIL